eukprot:430157-Prymnesium_polylepis.1
MAAFRNGRFRVLVATDVAARGLDMVVELVVNNKPPMKGGKPGARGAPREDTETYVHRSGRTGRAGRKGICVTLCGPRDREYLQNIERTTGNSFEWLAAPNPRTLLKTAAATAATDAATVEGDLCTLFAESAGSLLEAKGGDALAAISAALALATGTTKMPPTRSLLSGAVGMVTMHATFRQEVQSAGFVWGALRRVLPEGATDDGELARGMRLTADLHGAIVDLSEKMLEDEA